MNTIVIAVIVTGVLFTFMVFDAVYHPGRNRVNLNKVKQPINKTPNTIPRHDTK